MFKIKQAALISGFSVDTLRFYHKRGIAEPSVRSDNGYRYYTDDDILRLHFIKRAKQVGFSLEEVRELLDMRLNKSEKSCEEVKQITAEKLKQVDEKIRELNQIKKALSRLHDNCCGGVESAVHCSILQSLDSVGGL